MYTYIYIYTHHRVYDTQARTHAYQTNIIKSLSHSLSILIRILVLSFSGLLRKGEVICKY